MALKVKHLFSGSAIGVAMQTVWQRLASSLALPTSFRTASLESVLGKCFLCAEGRDFK